jgi:hypothetical protein
MKISSVPRAVSGPVDRTNKVFFREDEKQEWMAEFYDYGWLGLSLKHAAYGYGCSLPLLQKNSVATSAYQQGLAARNAKLERQLEEQIDLDPSDYPNEMKLGIMGVKQTALKMKMKQLADRENMAERMGELEQTTKAIQALSDEALKAKIEEIRNKL